MENTENQRLKFLITQLGFRSQKDFADKIGIKQGSLSDILRGKGGLKVSESIKYKLEILYKVNRIWLETGVGEMIVDPSNTINEPEGNYKNNDTVESKSIPMYSFPASASDIEMYRDASDTKPTGYLTIPGATKDSYALQVHGQSMYPTLEDGCWCIIRPINDRSEFEWGQIYYIEYSEYRVFKRILKSEDTDNIILWSDNQDEKILDKPKFAAKQIRKDQVLKLCLLTDILTKPNY